MVRNERILCVIVDITSYFTPVLISFRYFFPLLFSSALPCRLDFPMQRYSGRPASSTAVLTARGLPGSLPKSEMSFQSPAMLCLSGWVFREIPGCLLAFPSFPRCLTCM